MISPWNHLFWTISPGLSSANPAGQWSSCTHQHAFIIRHIPQLLNPVSWPFLTPTNSAAMTLVHANQGQPGVLGQYRVRQRVLHPDKRVPPRCIGTSHPRCSSGQLQTHGHLDEYREKGAKKDDEPCTLVTKTNHRIAMAPMRWAEWGEGEPRTSRKPRPTHQVQRAHQVKRPCTLQPCSPHRLSPNSRRCSSGHRLQWRLVPTANVPWAGKIENRRHPRRFATPQCQF